MQITEITQSHWSSLEVDSGALFHSLAWQDVLNKSFGSHSLLLINSSLTSRFAITVFKIGPVKIGYLGFPLGGFLDEPNTLCEDDVNQLRKCLRGKLTCLRIPKSAFLNGGELSLPCVKNPETAITKLQQWDLTATSKNIRRDIKKAAREGIVVSDATQTESAQVIFSLYRETIRRANGALRYNLDYFANLISCSKHSDNLRVLLAYKDNQIAGFNVVGIHQNNAYYLHGGVTFELRQHRPASLLMLEAIEWGKHSGCEMFNFMSSPQDQASLVEYKEKWGGQTRFHHTYTLGVGSFYSAFLVAERVRNIVGSLKINRRS